MANNPNKLIKTFRRIMNLLPQNNLNNLNNLNAWQPIRQASLFKSKGRAGNARSWQLAGLEARFVSAAISA